MFLTEDFLYFVWKNALFETRDLLDDNGERIKILFPGYRNDGPGPDFTEAKIKIGEQLWVGNVEIHLKSSDWYAHHHETDKNYDSVILHVVYQHDMPVFNTHGVRIPALELKDKIFSQVSDKYLALQSSEHALKCSPFLPDSDLRWTKWKERLFIERLESKVRDIHRLLDENINDWEQVLFMMLLRYFGMLHNTDSFLQIAKNVDFKVFRKYLERPHFLEALLMGVAGMLDEVEIQDDYVRELVSTYHFLRHKHQLKNIDIPITHGRMRPANFPAVRLSQFAMLYHRHAQLFEKLMHAEELSELQNLLRVSVSSYWESHYFPGKESKRRKKILGKSFINSLIINVILPFRFAYAKYLADERSLEKSIQPASELPAENNRIVRLFIASGLAVRHAGESQAVVQLYKNYCTQNNCINCAIGKNILSRANN